MTDMADETTPAFLDLVENGWAAETNPLRTGIFIRRGVRRGRMNAGPYLVLTDGQGEFWEVSARSERLRIVGNLLDGDRLAVVDPDSPEPPLAPAASDEELPGMWSNADFTGGQTDV